MTDTRETCLIGDVHGCYDELQLLLKAINFNPKHIRLILVGDYGDRGPKSAECVWFIRSLCENGDAEGLLGNHEEKHIRRRGHEIKKVFKGKKNPMRPMSKVDDDFHRKLSDADISWMKNLPLNIHIKDNWYAIHGGLETAYDFHHQSPNQIMRCRYVSNGAAIHNDLIIEKGKAVPLKKNKTPKENTIYWADDWNGPESIVFGHHVHSLTNPLIIERPNNVRCIGIDTGCVFGGFLTAFFLERNKFVKIKAKQEYYKQELNEE